MRAAFEQLHELRPAIDESLQTCLRHFTASDGREVLEDRLAAVLHPRAEQRGVVGDPDISPGERGGAAEPRCFLDNERVEPGVRSADRRGHAAGPAAEYE